MEVRVTLEHLRAGEKPLAMFLHDALRSIDEQYFESIVASFARNSRDQGMSSNDHRDRMLDERGRRKTSLEQFDLTFLTNLGETLTRDHNSNYSDNGIPQHIRTTFRKSIHLRSDVSSRFQTLRKYRNEIVHHHLERGDIATTILELGNILNVFRGELLACCTSQPDVFTEATVSSIQAYVDTIVSILKNAQAAEQTQVEDLPTEVQSVAHDIPQVGSSQPPAQPTSKRQLPKLAFAVGGAAILALAIVLLLRFTNAEQEHVQTALSAPVATKAAVFMMNEPLPEDKVAKFCKDIARKLSDNQSVYRITIVRYNESDTTVFVRLDSLSVARVLVPIMSKVKRLPSVLSLSDLFDGFVIALLDSSSLTVNATVKMFGNIPLFSESEIDSLSGSERDTVSLLENVEGIKSTFGKLSDRRLGLIFYRPAEKYDSIIAKRLKRGIELNHLDLEQL
jgi:hypothetical protein